MKSNWQKAVVALLVILLGGCCIFLYFSFISFPSTESIARSYLNAVIRQDLETALRWTPEHSDCQRLARDGAIDDIAQYGGSDIQNVTINVWGNAAGSDDEMQFAQVSFEYRNDDEVWHNGEMKIFTDHDVPGIRYTCGNMLRD